MTKVYYVMMSDDITKKFPNLENTNEAYNKLNYCHWIRHFLGIQSEHLIHEFAIYTQGKHCYLPCVRYLDPLYQLIVV